MRKGPARKASAPLPGKDRRLESALGRALLRRGWTLALAESCTGGLAGARLTSVAGSSRYFLGGAVAYADRAKSALLGVPRRLLAEHGAVSKPCALAMARGIKRVLGADLGLSITGIAGPGGGSRAKPTGLVFIALAGPRAGQERCFKLRLGGGRQAVRQRAAACALALALRCCGAFS
ncbi:MAG: nicotinamide-nucleotide amidohydrolase family protein [Elusimicrobia bacterium]|nr:nicotinamide-nucleotide amidohydrolase family protein [Elusimicrobiota bacterium]MDE2425557.1 nicotinamide-nucleotide amidohydrolase family protein [Elusimicrobiota bacterium]